MEGRVSRAVAWAASWDAGNRSARAAGRTHWNADDLSAANDTFDHLWPPERDGFPPEARSEESGSP